MLGLTEGVCVCLCVYLSVFLFKLYSLDGLADFDGISHK